MNKKITFVLILILSSVIYLSSGCKKDSNTDVREFKMAIDSTQHADTIALGEIFEIKFFGVLGPNDCYEYARHESAFGLDIMEFTLYAKEIKRDDCGGGGRYLNGGSLSITELTVGEWSIKVNQPEGIAPLNSKVFIKE